MKWFSILFLCLMVITLCGASFSIKDSLIKQVDVTFTNDLSVNAVNFQVTPIPTSVVSNITGKDFDWNPVNGKGIIYGMTKNTSIQGGLILTLKFDNITDNTQVLISGCVGADAAAKRVVVGGAEGSITLYFPYASVVDTAMEVVGLGDNGTDMNNDGVYDAVDVQLLMKDRKSVV
jgi:hypothetical protein